MSTDAVNSSLAPTDIQFPQPVFPVYRFSVDEYLRMADSGLLAHANVELLDGIIVPKMTRNSWHDAVLGIIEESIAPLLPCGWTTRVQVALVAIEGVPEPDLAIVRGSRRDYLRQRPCGTDAAIVIEVADSSVSIDRQKAAIYCAAGVPTYWIINGVDQCIEVFERQSPSEQQYSPKRVLRGHEQVDLTIDGKVLVTFVVDQLVPWLSATNPK